MSENDFAPIAEQLLSRASNLQGAFARIYPLYQKFQTARFQTMGASEGFAWEPLKANSPYAKYKPRMYGGGPRRKSHKREAGKWNSYPGNGTKLMIATGTLAGAVIGPSSGSPFGGIDKHRAVFGPNQMSISVEESGVNLEGKKFEYGNYADQKRPVMKFGQASIDQMRGELMKFILGK